jgi:hypothetical protein
VRVLGGSRWWFGEVSNNFELDRDRHGGEFMHDANSWIIGRSHIAPNNGMHRWIR